MHAASVVLVSTDHGALAAPGLSPRAGASELRLVAAAWTPLTFDEAYYWMWSKALAGGYYDHPPMVAIVIRLGTMIAGDTPFGVRLVSILLALPMSWAIYRAAAILFGGQRIAASATILLNVTLMAAVGTLIVTPDAPLLVAASLLLYALANLLVAATFFVEARRVHVHGIPRVGHAPARAKCARELGATRCSRAAPLLRAGAAHLRRPAPRAPHRRHGRWRR